MCLGYFSDFRIKVTVLLWIHKELSQRYTSSPLLSVFFIISDESKCEGTLPDAYFKWCASTSNTYCITCNPGHKVISDK